MAKSSERQTDILERGDIFFLYKPRVNQEEPSSLKDIQRFFIALRPDAGEKVRLLAVGRKRLPEARKHERHWGFVDFVANSGAELEQEFRGGDYETKTGGERRQPAVRPAGEGVYAITLANGQMRLSYALEAPRRPSDVQQAFEIEPEASFVLSIKNPEKGQPPGSGLRRRKKADFPEDLQKEFRGRRFENEDVRLLDFPGAEFILVGARPDPKQAYGVDLPTEETDEKSADIFRELHLTKSRHPIEPLFKGEWK